MKLGDLVKFDKALKHLAYINDGCLSVAASLDECINENLNFSTRINIDSVGIIVGPSIETPKGYTYWRVLMDSRVCWVEDFELSEIAKL